MVEAGEGQDARGGIRVLKISHSAVVAAWRERERALRRQGIELTMVSSAAWDEGGRLVRFEASDDRFAYPVRTFGGHPNAFLFNPRPLRQLLKADWDVIDVHEEPCSLATAELLLLRFLCRARGQIVLYSAQNIAKRYPPPFRWFERWALHQAGAVVVCNSAAGRILRRKGLSGTLAEIPLGIDLEHFRPETRNPPDRGRLRMGYVGRLAPHKGVPVLLDAVHTRPHWHLEVAGAGPDAARLRQRVIELGIEDRVSFRGAVEQAALPTHYRSLDVVVVPSLPTPSWEEQFCRVAVEAMACGIPVVASRCGALPEVVGDAGLLFDPGDPAALRTALDTLAADPEQWEWLRKLGLERAERFSWEEVAGSYLSLYRVLSSRGSSESNNLRQEVGVTPQASPKAHGIDARAPGPTVVVVAYGPVEPLESCLASLEGMFPLVVVDNGSSPETRSVVEFHGGQYLDPGRNLGFAAGVNYALRHRPPGADVLLLNPDARIEPDGVSELQRRLHADPSLACVAPAQVEPAHEAQARVGWPWPTPTGAWLEAFGLGRLRKRCDFLIGSVLLVRGAAIDDIGPFDERFFLYAEETDWQLRARRHGWRVGLCREVMATHIGGGTSGDPARREAHFHASHEKLIRKHHGEVGWRVVRAACVTGALARSLILHGARRHQARRRLSLYWHGPSRSEELLAGEGLRAGGSRSDKSSARRSPGSRDGRM